MADTPAVKPINIGSPAAMKALRLNSLMNWRDKPQAAPLSPLSAAIGLDGISSYPYLNKIGLMGRLDRL
jgi:hypothetical protein